MYQIIFEAPAQRQFRKLARIIQTKILKTLIKLEENPRPAGCKKLQGLEHLYRLRIGDYRVIYRVKDNKLLVLIISLGHRREIYKKVAL